MQAKLSGAAALSAYIHLPADSMNDAEVSVLPCPHCGMLMEIPHEHINCAIYRHATFKVTGQQIDPHAPKEICDRLVELGLVHGCGKPFRVRREAEGWLVAEACEYL